MARRIIYKIEDNGINHISDTQWQEILNIQRWYNSEFFWSAGKLAFKRFLAFPNYEVTNKNKYEYRRLILREIRKLTAEGRNEAEILSHLEALGLIFLKKGGYFENSISSGFTRVAQNEFNAFLVCEFLLKSSLVAVDAVIDVIDEGNFIKCKHILLKNGNVIIPYDDKSKINFYNEIIDKKKVFSIVNPAKYDNLKILSHSIPNYNKLTKKEKQKILHDWNYLGFENTYDFLGDDFIGYDLNQKVKNFIKLVDY